MARKPSARVKLNRKAVGQVALAIADGTQAVGRAIEATAVVPDAEPYGSGLVDSPGVITYVGAKKVAGWGADGRQPKKPRAMRVKGSEFITTGVGFSFPARFLEFGTQKMSARPFFTPARNKVVPRVESIMRQAAAYRVARFLGRER